MGLGAIGSMVANLALELGMKVSGFDPAISVESAWRLSSRVLKVDSLDVLVQHSDYISLHIPANEKTKNLINAEMLSRFREGSRLLNFCTRNRLST